MGEGENIPRERRPTWLIGNTDSAGPLAGTEHVVRMVENG